MTKEIILTDRSSNATSLECQRKIWYSRWLLTQPQPGDRPVMAGTTETPLISLESTMEPQGLQPRNEPIYLSLGSGLHRALQSLIKGASLDNSLEAGMSIFQEETKDSTTNSTTSSTRIIAEPDHPDVQYAIREAKDLIKALTLCYYKERLERFLQEYRTLAIEPEIRTVLYEEDSYQVVLQSRPDAIIERISDGALLQWELKSKQSINKNWMDSWEHNLQLIGQQLAVKQWASDNGLGDRLIVGAMIEALIKGKRDKDKYTGLWQQSTPLIYAYTKRGDGMLMDDQVSQTWKKGWPKQLVSEFMPLEQWVLHELSSEITATKCVAVMPIAPSEYDIEQAAEQWGIRAISEYEASRLINNEPDEQRRQSMLNRCFPQATNMCFQYGRCWAYDLCFGSAGADPIGSGMYTHRVPNHPQVEE